MGIYRLRRLVRPRPSERSHTVYAGMYSHDGNTSTYEAEINTFNEENDTDLRPIPLNLLDQSSINAAVQKFFNQAMTIDVVVHNAGHMNYGPAEAFTAEQYLRIFDVNVVGAQRLNQAVLPHMRTRRRGHLVWISSSSVHGGKAPWVGAYFAAKAAMDSLAQTYARELHLWGIETTILTPGVFTSGTHHFQDAMEPGNAALAAEYEAEGAPTEGVGEQNMRGMASVVPEGVEAGIVADALVMLSRVGRVLKPYRVTVDPADDGAKEGAAIVDRFGADTYRRLGLEKMLKVAL